MTISALRAENQALRDEVARSKGLPPRPPSRPSGMEQATQPGAADKDPKRSKSPCGVKRNAQAITAERMLKVAVPADSRFKGYGDILVRDLRLSAEVSATDVSAGCCRGARRCWLLCRLRLSAGSARSCSASCWPCMPKGRSLRNGSRRC